MERSRRSRHRVWLAGLAVLALVLRCLGAEYVFVESGDVVFYVGDPYFHLHRALATLAEFPRFLSFDRYLNFPEGSAVPSPPGYDLLVAGVTLLLGGTQARLEQVAAVLPALLGAATVFPVHALGRRIGGPRVGLLAAFLVAALPANAVYSLLGYADHHAAVAFLVASWIAIAAGIADTRGGGSLAVRCIALAMVRAALVATWSGSVLYLALGDVSLVLALVVSRSDAAPLAAVAFSLAASALAITPLVLASPTPLGGTLSTIDLSWLQPLACAALAAWAALLALRGRSAPQRSDARRMVEAVAIGGVAVAAMLAVPAIRENLAVGLAFVSKQDAWGAVVIEQRPLFSRAPGAIPATMLFGWLAFAVPIAPLAALPLVHRPATRGVGLVLLAWSLALAGLTLSQNRYAGDLSVVASPLFAFAIAAAADAAARRTKASVRIANATAAALALVLVAPGIAQLQLVQARQSFRNGLAALRGAAPAHDRALATSHGTLLRFAQEIRRVTPETSGFRDAGDPEYGVLCDPSLGYTIQYTARRPTPASNAGPYVSPENTRAVQRFLGTADEAEAAAIADRLRVRYVVTEPRSEYPPRSLLHRLHAFDGAAHGRFPRLERLRLVTEGPAGGTPLAVLLGNVPAWGQVPYKLFEIVPGAQLEVPGAPGAPVAARIALVTPLGRTLAYRADAEIAANGRALVRVPYATDGDAPVRAIGPWRVTVGDAVYRVPVSDADVRAGRTLRVDPSSRERAVASVAPGDS